MLLTNDGDFAQRMSHPSYQVEKTYVAEVDGDVGSAVLERLAEGVELDDGPVHPTGVRLAQRGRGRSVVELTLHEGRNRIVRRLLAEVGHPVRQLSRTRFGPVTLSGLATGRLRELTDDEVGALLDAADAVGR